MNGAGGAFFNPITEKRRGQAFCRAFRIRSRSMKRIGDSPTADRKHLLNQLVLMFLEAEYASMLMSSL